MKKTLFSLLLMLVTVSALQAEILTGVVDLERIFREYYKSRIAEELIRRQAEVYRTYIKKLESEHKALLEEARRARAESQNLALAPAERQKAEERALSSAKAVAAKKAEAESYARERAVDMRQLQSRKRAEILKDIQAQIKRSAALLGYGFVLDRSGRTTNDLGAVLLYPPQRDFTQHVINELNRNQARKNTKAGVK
ncbi:MAG: OmpH family outer membrane protein [Lentisphaeria bacterium]|nr:OmpH family outer membrane protein [Lentisphaeria bacterium]